MKIIPKYIIREILPPFLVNLLVFTFILLMAKVLELTELVVVKGVSASTILTMLLYSLPLLLSMTIPMSTLLAVLLSFLRLSGDNEITVLKSAGMGLYQLLPPVILFCLAAYAITTYLSVTVVPLANTAFKNELLTLAKTRADVGIKERVFYRGFDNMVLFVNSIPMGSDVMEKILIKDSREKDVVTIIVADRGRLTTDKKNQALVFELFDGVIDRVYRSYESTDTIRFDVYKLKIDLAGAMKSAGQAKRGQYEMTMKELWEAIARYKREGHPKWALYTMEAHKRLSLPLACIVLGLAAVPLGVQFRSKGRNLGVTIGLIVFLIYYVMMSAGLSFGESGWYPPALAMWTPNIVLGLFALYTLRQANLEMPIGLVSVLNFISGLFRNSNAEKKEEP